jgi:hypothetical protein
LSQQTNQPLFRYIFAHSKTQFEQLEMPLDQADGKRNSMLRNISFIVFLVAAAIITATLAAASMLAARAIGQR